MAFLGLSPMDEAAVESSTAQFELTAPEAWVRAPPADPPTGVGLEVNRLEGRGYREAGGLRSWRGNEGPIAAVSRLMVMRLLVLWHHRNERMRLALEKITKSHAG
jgi:hypothetical protein